MVSEIIINEDLEEKINYPDRRWPHVILHTSLSETLLGYIPLHWHYALQFMYVTNGVIKVKLAENTLEIHEGKDYLLIQTLYMKFVTRMKARVSIAGTLIAQCHGTYQFYLC